MWTNFKIRDKKSISASKKGSSIIPWHESRKEDSSAGHIWTLEHSECQWGSIRRSRRLSRFSVRPLVSRYFSYFLISATFFVLYTAQSVHWGPPQTQPKGPTQTRSMNACVSGYSPIPSHRWYSQMLFTHRWYSRVGLPDVTQLHPSAPLIPS